MESIKNSKILQIPDKVNETSDKLTYDLEIDLYPHILSTKSIALLRDFTSILAKNESQIQKDPVIKDWLFFTQSLAQADPESVKEFLSTYFSRFKNINITLRSVEVVENSKQLTATIQIGDQFILYPLLVTTKKSGGFTLKLPTPPSSVGGWHKLATQNPEIYLDWDKFYMFNGSQNPSIIKQKSQSENPKVEIEQASLSPNIESQEFPNTASVDDINTNETASRVEIEPQSFVMSIYNEPDFDQLMQKSELLKQKQYLEQTLSFFSSYDPNVDTKLAILFGLPENTELSDSLNELADYLQFLNGTHQDDEVTVDKKSKFQKLDKTIDNLRSILHSISLNSNHITQSLLAPYLKSLHQIRLHIFNQNYNLAITTIRTEILLEYNLKGATKLQDSILKQINSEINDLDIVISNQHELHNSVQLGYGGVENPKEVDWYLFYQIQGIKNLLTDETGEDKFRLISEELKNFTAKYFSEGSEISKKFANKWKIKGIDPDTVFPNANKMRYEGRTLKEVVDSSLFQNANKKITVEELRNALIFLREFGGKQITIDDNNSKNKETIDEYVKLTTVISDFIETAIRGEIHVKEKDLADLNKILENIQKDVETINIFRKALYFVTLDYNSENGIKIKAALLKIIFTRKYFNLIKSSTEKEDLNFNDLVLKSAIDAKNFNIYLKDIYKDFIHFKALGDENSKFDYDAEKKQEYLNDPKFWSYVLEQIKYDDVSILRSLFIQFTSNAQTNVSNIDESATLPQKKNMLVTNDQGKPEVIKIETLVDLGQLFNLLKVRRTFTYDESLGLVPASLTIGYSRLVDGVDGNFSFIPFREIENSRGSGKRVRNSESSQNQNKIDTESKTYSGDRTITIPGSNLPHGSFKWQTGVLLPDEVVDQTHPDFPKYQQLLDQSGQIPNFNGSNHTHSFSREGSLLNPAPQNYWTVASIPTDSVSNPASIEIVSQPDQEEAQNLVLETEDGDISSESSSEQNETKLDINSFWERIDVVNKFQNGRRALAEACQAKLNVPREDRNQFYDMGLLPLFTEADKLAQSFGISDPILRTQTSNTEVDNILEGVELIHSHLSNPEESFGGFLSPLEIKVIAQSKDAFHEIFLDANVYKLMSNSDYEKVKSEMVTFEPHAEILITVLKNSTSFLKIQTIVQTYEDRFKTMIIESTSEGVKQKQMAIFKEMIGYKWTNGFNIEPNKLEAMLYWLCTTLISNTDHSLFNNQIYTEYFEKGDQPWIKYGIGMLELEKIQSISKNTKKHFIRWMEFILSKSEEVKQWQNLQLTFYKPDLIARELTKYFSDSLLQNKIGSLYSRLEKIEELDVHSYLVQINNDLKLIYTDKPNIHSDVLCQIVSTTFDSMFRTLNSKFNDRLLILIGYHLIPDSTGKMSKRVLINHESNQLDLKNDNHKSMLDYYKKLLNSDIAYNVILSKEADKFLKTKQDILDFVKIGECFYLQVFYTGLGKALGHTAKTGDKYFISEFDADQCEQIMAPVSARISTLLDELNNTEMEVDASQTLMSKTENLPFAEMSKYDEQMFTQGQFLKLAIEGNELIKNAYDRLLEDMNAQDSISFKLILRQAYSITNGTPFLKQSSVISSLLQQNAVSEANDQIFTVLCKEYPDFNKLKTLYENNNFMKVLIKTSLGVYSNYSMLAGMETKINQLANVTPSTIKPSLKNRISFGMNYIIRNVNVEIFVENLETSKRLVQYCITLFRQSLFQAIYKDKDKLDTNDSYLRYLLGLDLLSPVDDEQITQILGTDYHQKIENLLLPNIVLSKNPTLTQVKNLVKMLPKATNYDWLQYWPQQISKLFAVLQELPDVDTEDITTYWNIVFGEIGFSNTKSKTSPEIELFTAPALEDITEIEAEITLEDLNYQVTESILSVVSEEELFNTKIGETPLIDVLTDYIEKIDYNSFQAIPLPPDFRLWEVRTFGPEIILMKFSEIMLRDYGLQSLFDLTNMYNTIKKSVSLNTAELDPHQLQTYKTIILNLLGKLKLDNQAINSENPELLVIKNPNQISQYTNGLNQKLLQAGKNLKIDLTFDTMSVNQTTMENFSKKLNLIMQQFINSDEKHLQTFLSDSIVQSGSNISSAIPVGMQLKFISPSEQPYYTLALPQEFRTTNILRGRVSRENRFRCGFKIDEQGNQEMIVYYLGNDHDSI
jgi:hypothetical protein